MTVSFWAKHDSGQGSNEDIISDYDGGGANVFEISYAANELLTCDLSADTAESVTLVTLTDTEWHHYVCHYDGTNLTAYFDGQQANQTGLTGVIDATTADLFIGRGDSGSGREWAGSMDDVRIYNRALSVEEITRLYQLGR